MRKWLVRYYLVDWTNRDKVFVWKKAIEADDEFRAMEAGDPNEDNLPKRFWPQLLNWNVEELLEDGRRKDGGPVIGVGEFPVEAKGYYS